MGIPYNFVFLIYLFFLAKDSDISILMLVSVIASLMQVLIQVPAIRHSGYRYSLNVNLKDPYLKKAFVLILPVLVGSAVQQINVIIDKTLASDLVEGSISSLTYASRVNDMVISVFVAAITTVVFPMLSQAFSKDDRGEVKRILNQGVNIILIITVPATVGLMLLASPLVQLFFERGAFEANATAMTSGALVFYSLGLVGAALRLMLNKVFYSFQDTKTPMINGAIAVVSNIILNLILIKPLGHRGLALATSISATITTLLLFMDLRKKVGHLGYFKMLYALIKTIIASLIMGILVYLIYYKLGALIPESKLIQTILLLGSVLIGVIVYFALLIVMKVEEVRVILRKVVR